MNGRSASGRNRQSAKWRRGSAGRNLRERFTAIRKMAIKWHEDKLVRGFIQAFEEASQQFKFNDAARREVQALLDWSKRYAESITLEARVARILNVFRGDHYWTYRAVQNVTEGGNVAPFKM